MRSSIAFSVAALFSLGQSIATISAKGSKFFTSDGNQWFIKGKSINHTLSTDMLNSIPQVSRTSSHPMTHLPMLLSASLIRL